MTNRTLDDIIETARDGQRPDPEEGYYALLALAALADILQPRTNPLIKETLDRARELPPRAFLANRTPGDPEYDAHRRAKKRLVAEVTKVFDDPEIREAVRRIGDTLPPPIAPPPAWWPERKD